MAKIVRLTESDLNRIVRRAIQESKNKKIQEQTLNPEELDSGVAIITMVTTVLSLLGIAGSHYIKAMIDKLRKKGEDDKADEVQDALDMAMNKDSESEEGF